MWNACNPWVQTKLGIRKETSVSTVLHLPHVRRGNNRKLACTVSRQWHARGEWACNTIGCRRVNVNKIGCIGRLSLVAGDFRSLANQNAGFGVRL